jgi:hypothetical protein
MARRTYILLYALAGAALCWSRFVGLNQGFWHDEIYTVVHFVHRGPHAILIGEYVPNNHELFSLLAWATEPVTGLSESSLRLLSAVPFVFGVFIGAAWLHARLGWATGVMYALLAAACPLLVQLSRQARGYGLAYLAMSALLVATLEAPVTKRRRPMLFMLFGSGCVGTLTLPNFGVAFVATVLPLLTVPRLKRDIVLGLLASGAVITVFYLPHLGAILDNSHQKFGAPLPWHGLVTGPIAAFFLPAFLLPLSLATPKGIVMFAFVVGLVLAGISRLRDQGSLLQPMSFVSGIVVTFALIWAARLYLEPRFVSFLLVPLLMLVSIGLRDLLRTKRHAVVRVLARSTAITTVLLVSLLFIYWSNILTRKPLNASKEAAQAASIFAAQGAEVYVRGVHPEDVHFYLKSYPVRSNWRTICHARQKVVLVNLPFRLRAPTLPCLNRSGVDHERFVQWGDGGAAIDVWYLPVAVVR